MFGMQLVEFQTLNHIVKIRKENIFFNHHPLIAGKFVYTEQINQIFLHQNINKLNHCFVIIRMYSQSIEDSICVRLKLKRKIFLSSFREQGLNGSLMESFKLDSFPKFSEEHTTNYKKYISLNIPKIDINKPLIAVHSRSGNFPKNKQPARVCDISRNTSFNEINYISSEFQTRNFNFIRIGYFEEYDKTQSCNIIDIRREIQDDNVLQSSIFALTRGYVGSSSGPLSFFAIQKMPCLLISVYPFDLNYPFSPEDVIVIPKFIYDLKNRRVLSKEEQFDENFVKLQNLYNDRLILNKQFEPRSLPPEITRKIYTNWQSSILNKDLDSKWLRHSINASNSLKKATTLQNLPIIPVEYFDYLVSQNS